VPSRKDTGAGRGCIAPSPCPGSFRISAPPTRWIGRFRGASRN